MTFFLCFFLGFTDGVACGTHCNEPEDEGIISCCGNEITRLDWYEPVEDHSISTVFPEFVELTVPEESVVYA